jgi:hypothetical protein
MVEAESRKPYRRAPEFLGEEVLGEDGTLIRDDRVRGTPVFTQDQLLLLPDGDVKIIRRRPLDEEFVKVVDKTVPVEVLRRVQIVDVLQGEIIRQLCDETRAETAVIPKRVITAARILVLGVDAPKWRSNLRRPRTPATSECSSSRRPWAPSSARP